MLLTVTNQLINNSAASLGQRQLIQKFDHGYNCFNKKECIRIGSYLLLSLPDVAPELSELTYFSQLGRTCKLHLHFDLCEEAFQIQATIYMAYDYLLSLQAYLDEVKTN